jgi:hypothetical protein
MTGLGHFTPGAELQCAGCEMHTGSTLEPDCLIAVDMRDAGEHMTPAACPGTRCQVCGGLLPCDACLTELRGDS